MNATSLPRRMLGRLRHPQTTVRWRLTLLYGGLFLISGAGLLTITYVLLARANGGAYGVSRPTPGLQQFGWQQSVAPRVLRSGPQVVQIPPNLSHALSSKAGKQAVSIVISNQRLADLHQLLIESLIALGIMALISGGLGWMVAGRVLRPLRTMTNATQQISATSLHTRLAMPGPRDELRQLAATIDGLLARLEKSFDAQRRFVANASHELRTPLTTIRALVEMSLADPKPTVNELRQTCAHVLEETEQQEQLIDSLLALARGQRGIDRPEALDLSVIAAYVVHRRAPAAAEQGIRLEGVLEPSPMSGDRQLITRLTANLVENALRYNRAEDGWIRVSASSAGGRAILEIENQGPRIQPDQVERLLLPFQRLGAERVGQHQGAGLGLSIVAAVAEAHGAELSVTARSEGGLRVRVSFPGASGPPGPAEPVAPAPADGEIAPVQSGA